jgi:hypothetical protein
VQPAHQTLPVTRWVPFGKPVLLFLFLLLILLQQTTASQTRSDEQTAHSTVSESARARADVHCRSAEGSAQLPRPEGERCDWHGLACGRDSGEQKMTTVATETRQCHCFAAQHNSFCLPSPSRRYLFLAPLSFSLVIQPLFPRSPSSHRRPSPPTVLPPFSVVNTTVLRLRHRPSNSSHSVLTARTIARRHPSLDRHSLLARHRSPSPPSSCTDAHSFKSTRFTASLHHVSAADHRYRGRDESSYVAPRRAYTPSAARGSIVQHTFYPFSH